MQLFRSSKRLAKKAGCPVLTLGNFDGLHLGHRKILARVRDRARALGCSSVVYTFEPHPLKVVAPHRSPPMLIDASAKASLVEALGIDYMVVARFTREFAAKHPRQFVEDELVPLGVREVWVGHDFSFGRGRAGTAAFLAELGAELGFSVHVMPAYKRGAQVVSSSRIRRLVGDGKVGEAAALLGRPYSISGAVVRGKDLGRRIGFPTANLRVESELLPADGVYAAYAMVSGVRREAVVNIGMAPTFGGRRRCVEVHLLGFSEEIYGLKLEVEFIRRLRGERAFPSIEALARQIARDAHRAASILRGRAQVKPDAR